MATAPGDLGLGRAYVAGDLDVDGAHPGDPYEAFKALGSWRLRRPSADGDRRRWSRRWAGATWCRPPRRHRRRCRAGAVRLKACGTRGAATRRRSTTTTTSRTSSTEMVLGPSMAYTCAVFPKPDASLEEAQEEKFDLVARKLGLSRGMRMLDVGCGWGGMSLHAAKHYGVHAVGVTLVEGAGCLGRRGRTSAKACLTGITILHSDYRDSPGQDYDAISSIGLTEHVGIAQLPGVLRVPARQAARRWPAAQPLHHPTDQRHLGEDRGVHRPLRVPRRRAHRIGPDHHRGPGRRASRYATRRTCASTTR